MHDLILRAFSLICTPSIVQPSSASARTKNHVNSFRPSRCSILTRLSGTPCGGKLENCTEMHEDVCSGSYQMVLHLGGSISSLVLWVNSCIHGVLDLWDGALPTLPYPFATQYLVSREIDIYSESCLVVIERERSD